jgi:hypothetical protein
MSLSPKQKAILISLYRRYVDSGKRDTFVASKGVTSMTMKSLYKTGFIESDRVIQGVPCNARITDAGIKEMEQYFDVRKKSVDSIIARNKHYMRFVQNTEEKRIALQQYIEGYPIALYKDVVVTHCGYGVFEVIIASEEPQYYGVYSREEGNAIEVGECYEWGIRPWYIEKVRLI